MEATGDQQTDAASELDELAALGVDLTLVREMLAMTPDERLAWHGRMVRLVRRLQNARPQSR